MAVLYLCYDGLMEQLGQSQVLQYLIPLSKSYRIVLVTYEKKSDWADVTKREALRQEVKRHGIIWVPLRYHKRFSVLATSYDLAIGFFVSLYLAIRYQVRIVHARSYVMSVLAIALKRLLPLRFIFDMRGFWVDQRLEMGMWSSTSQIYRLAKNLEKKFILEADVVIALSRKAVEAMRTWPYVRSKAIHFEVITTCTNLDLFKPTPEHQKGTASPFVLGYVGNAGPGYLFDPVVRSFLEMRRRRPDAMLRIINRRDHVYIRETLSRYGVDENCIDLRGVEHNEVPRQMASMDAGVFFIRPDPSRISSVPTRMGEFLACGVPCLGNAGVGDVEEVLEGHRVGVVLRDFETGSISSAVDQLLQMATDTSVRQRCVETARLCSSLEAGVQTYDRIYRELSSGAT